VALGAVAAAQASGLGPAVLPAIALRRFLGALAALFALSLLGNATSSSRVERLHGVPLATVLVLSCAILALGG
jgi:hypothetical protein